MRLTAPRSAGRHDGWTPQRQLDFLEIVSGTGSVTRSARAVGMNRESAYRLRSREPDGLFAAAWERALTPNKLLAANQRKVDEGHIRAFAAACGLRSKTPCTAVQDDQHRKLTAAHLVIAARLRTTL